MTTRKLVVEVPNDGVQLFEWPCNKVLVKGREYLFDDTDKRQLDAGGFLWHGTLGFWLEDWESKEASNGAAD